jgi:hypothetical protein
LLDSEKVLNRKLVSDDDLQKFLEILPPHIQEAIEKYRESDIIEVIE